MIQYLILVTAYTGAMLLLYQLLLRDKPMHGFNRIYLLSATILPVVLPLLKLPEAIRPQQEAKPVVVMLQEVTVGATTEDKIPYWLLLIPAVYLLGLIIMLVMKLAGFIKMRRVVSRSDKEQYEGYTLLKYTGYGPGSWGKYIFLPEGEVDATIIQHELSHVRMHHSGDIVFISLVQAVFWPNVFIHLLKKELVQVHEFQADAAVGVSGEDYTKLLLSSIFGTCTLPFTHSFIIHPIKRRIMMLHNNRKHGKLRGVIATASASLLLAGIITMQSCEQKKEPVSLLTEAKTEKINDSIVSFVHKMPSPGYNVGEYLGKVIEYPAEAKKNKIEGRVFVQFVVGKDGKISNIRVKDTKADPMLADAAIKAIAQLPDWIPGEDEHGNKVAVFYNLPINFKLDENDKKTSFRELNDQEAEEVKRNLERDMKIMSEKLAGDYEPAVLNSSDPEYKNVMGQMYSLLSEAVNGPAIIYPKEQKSDITGEEKYTSVVKDRSLTLDQIVEKLTNGEGVEVENVHEVSINIK